MFLWKEKVADKLSRLLADSPSSRPPPPTQAMPSSFEEASSPKKSSVSSYILSLLPTTSSGMDGQRSGKPSSPRAVRPLPFRSLSRRWKANGGRPLDSNVECGTESESDETVQNSKGNLDYDSERNITASDGIEEASTSDVSGELLPCLTEKSTFISGDLFEFLQSSLPNIVKGCDWVLLYSTVKHGISLRTLLRRSVNLSGPCLLIVGDMQGAIFGGLLDCPLKPTAKRKYQGTHQTFVFTTKYGEPRLFRATGANRYYYLCLNDALAFGGGGSFALCLDEDLLHGTSGPCETFGNLCLAHSPEFELKNVEVMTYVGGDLKNCLHILVPLPGHSKIKTLQHFVLEKISVRLEDDAKKFLLLEMGDLSQQRPKTWAILKLYKK